MKVLFLSFLLFFISCFRANAQQNPCLSAQTFKIVVLGSSTSAGSGASTSDSAWVNRYEDYLQEINPLNEIVNLGVGGYNTYRIMPSGFVPPAGRPNPDPTKNISAALAENPNAIIINMPSNDVALGFSYSEQMFNLDTIVSIAQQNNVPIWVCSTQPRNFSNQTQLDLQWEIKDSIYAYFNPHTIDFWTTLSTPSYTIEPFYDSGDGVHLNNAGHGVLANRAIQASIIDSIYMDPLSIDYSLVDILVSPSACGDSMTEVQLVVANVGLDDTSATYINLQSVNTTFFTSESDQYVYPTGLPSCSMDTLPFIINTYDLGDYHLTANVTNTLDSLSFNDVNDLQFTTSGHPNPYVLNDTLCDPGMAQLYMLSATQDEIFWYNDTLNPPLVNDELLNIPLIDTTTLFYAQAVRGNLFFSETLHTSLNSNINFNGTMFDLVASDSIVIDSFDVKINSLGTQGVEIFYKTGSHLGFELDPSAWTLLDDILVDVIDPNEWTTVPIGNLSIAQGDTFGIHIRMQSPGSNLSYATLSTPQIRSTPELTMITGSGISTNFGNSYYPRDWSGGVHYHFGERPLGDCASDKLEAFVVVSNSELLAGNDTILDIADTLVAQATSGFINYDWFNGSDSSSAIIAAVDLGIGIHYVDVYATDDLGCQRYDEFVVAVADLVGMNEINSQFSIAPNPTQDFVEIKLPENAQLNFTNINGQKLDLECVNGNLYSFQNLPPGVYFAHITIENDRFVQKIIKVG